MDQNELLDILYEYKRVGGDKLKKLAVIHKIQNLGTAEQYRDFFAGLSEEFIESNKKEMRLLMDLLKLSHAGEFFYCRRLFVPKIANDNTKKKPKHDPSWHSRYNKHDGKKGSPPTGH